MTRIIILFFVGTHALPFLVVGWVTGRALPVFVGAALAALLVCGIRAGERPGAEIAQVLPAKGFVPHRHAFFLSAVAYFAVRAPSIAEIARALWGGTFVQYALSLAIARYAEDGETTSPQFQLGTIAFFIVCGIAGAALGAYRIRRRAGRWATVGCVAVAIFIESASLARAGVLLGLTLAFTFFLLNRRAELGRIPGQRLFGALVSAAVLAVAIFLFSAYFRIMDSDSTPAGDVLTAGAKQYMIAEYDAFAQWLWRVGADDSPIGFNTFTFLFKLFGIRTQLGFYDPVITEFGETNVFLVYRGLVADFGIVGASLFVAGMGFVLGRVEKPDPSMGVMWLGAGTLCMVLFPLISPFSYATFSLALVFLLLVLRVQHPPVVPERAAA